MGLNSQNLQSFGKKMNVLNRVLVVLKKGNRKNVSIHNLSCRGFSLSCLLVHGPYFRPCFLFLCLFLSSLNRLKPMETFSKQLILSFKCLLNITDRNLYLKIVSRIKAKMWSYLRYCFQFSEVGLRESLLAAYLISLLPIID